MTDNKQQEEKAKEILLKHIPKDCLWEDMDNLVNTPIRYVLAAMEEFASTLSAVKKEGEGWISVQDRMPEIGEEYNVVWDLQDGGEPVTTTMQWDAIEKTWEDHSGTIPAERILFWQPLPSPPSTSPSPEQTKGMEKLAIYQFHARDIEDTLRMAANALDSYDRKTCLDRNIMQSWERMKNVLSGEIDKEAPYMPSQAYCDEVKASSSLPAQVKDESKENEIMLLKEDLWCVHQYLDDKKIPRQDADGKDYSIVGRIKQMEADYLKQLSDWETKFLNTQK